MARSNAAAKVVTAMARVRAWRRRLAAKRGKNEEARELIADLRLTFC